MATRAIRRIRGDDLLYRFFRDALEDHPERYGELPQLLLTSMGIWLPLTIYQQLPVLLPWVVRDRSARGKPSQGIPDAWSSPDQRGYLRDDNSLVKALTRSLDVTGPAGSHVRGGRMGTEFVAAHVWRVVEHPELASRIPLLNTFVPNLVWLPSQIAKLTDREASLAQQTLQAMSWHIYRHATVAGHLSQRVEEAWALIPEPHVSVRPFELSELNWFQATPQFLRVREARMREVVAALDALDEGRALPERVITSRYAEGLPSVGRDARADLRSFVTGFMLSGS